MVLCFPFWEIVLIFATSKTYSENTYMVIKTDKEYREYKEAANALLDKSTQFGGLDFLPKKDLEDYVRLANAICDWEEVHYPISNLSKIAFAYEMSERMKEKQRYGLATPQNMA